MDIEAKNDNLYNFLIEHEKEILKFIWKKDGISVIGKYIVDIQSGYNTLDEEKYGIEEICFNSVDYYIMSEIKEEWKTKIPIWALDLKDKVYLDYVVGKEIELNKWKENNILNVSIYSYPDEIRGIKDNMLWNSSELNSEYKEIIDNIHKEIEEKKNKNYREL